jgi:hypothetical protein
LRQVGAIGDGERRDECALKARIDGGGDGGVERLTGVAVWIDGRRAGDAGEESGGGELADEWQGGHDQTII